MPDDQNMQKRKNGESRIILKIVFTLALLAFAVSAVIFFRYIKEYAKGSEEYEEIAQGAVRILDSAGAGNSGGAGTGTDGTGGSGNKSGGDYQFLSVDFKALKAENPDVVAWIDAPGPEISYPVVQGTDNSYYLKRTFRGSYNFAGCIFMDSGSSLLKPDGNTVLYGHNMRNGSMFGRLRKYRDKSFYEEYPEFYLYLPDGEIYRCQITAGFDMGADAASLPLTFKEGEKASYLNQVSSLRWYNTGVSIGEEDLMVTLITCHPSGREDRRVAIQARAEQIKPEP